MLRYFINKTLTLTALTAVFISIGSVGVYFNWQDPAWSRLGVSPAQITKGLKDFPMHHCDDQIRPTCERVASGLGWFLGLNKI